MVVDPVDDVTEPVDGLDSGAIELPGVDSSPVGRVGASAESVLVKHN